MEIRWNRTVGNYGSVHDPEEQVQALCTLCLPLLRSYSLSYENFCTRNGAMQETAQTIDGLGFNATSDDPLLPNALLLRGAEAVDAVLNAALSGQQASATTSAGYILCSIERPNDSNRSVALL